MPDIPKEQKAAVKQGEGHDARAPVKTVEVPQNVMTPNDISLSKEQTMLTFWIVLSSSNQARYS